MTPVMSLDRLTARALVDAGYMPVRDYIERFGPEMQPQAGAVAPVVDIGHHRSRPWGISTHRSRPDKRHNSRALPKNSAA